MDQELRAYLEEMKSSIVDDLKATMEERFRHTEILIEGVHHEVRLVAEGVSGVSERLEAFKADTARRFEEIQSEFKPYYRNVNGRLSHLEDEVPALERRVTALETRASRRAGKKTPTQ